MNYMILTYKLTSNGSEHVTRFNLDNYRDTTRANSLIHDLLANRLTFQVTYAHE